MTAAIKSGLRSFLRRAMMNMSKRSRPAVLIRSIYKRHCSCIFGGNCWNQGRRRYYYCGEESRGARTGGHKVTPRSRRSHLARGRHGLGITLGLKIQRRSSCYARHRRPHSRYLGEPKPAGAHVELPEQLFGDAAARDRAQALSWLACDAACRQLFHARGKRRVAQREVRRWRYSYLLSKFPQPCIPWGKPESYAWRARSPDPVSRQGRPSVAPRWSDIASMLLSWSG